MKIYQGGVEGEQQLPEALKGLDPKLVEAIQNEMMDRNPGVVAAVVVNKCRIIIVRGR